MAEVKTNGSRLTEAAKHLANCTVAYYIASQYEQQDPTDIAARASTKDAYRAMCNAQNEMAAIAQVIAERTLERATTYR